MPPVMNMIVQRQLETLASGNCAYLAMFLRTVRRAGFAPRVIFSPWRSFGNRPWATLHPEFAALIDQLEWPRSIRLGRFFISTAPRVWWRFLVRIVKAAMRMAGLNPVIRSYLGEPLSDREAGIVARAAARRPAPVTIVEYSALGPVLRLIEYPTAGMVLMHDLLADRASRFRDAGFEPDFLEISREQEAEWVASASACIHASADEMHRFGAMASHAAHLWMRPEPPAYSTAPAGTEPRVVFMGTDHAGNTEAAKHFVDEIWPHVLASEPDVELWIAGSVGRGLDPELSGRRGVRILGRVDNLASIGGFQSVGAAPARLATGVSIKVAEYLALGMTCVAYPRALTGFGDALNALVSRAETPVEFADRVVEWLRDADGRRAMAERGPAQVQAILSNDEVVAYLRSAVSVS